MFRKVLIFALILTCMFSLLTPYVYAAAEYSEGEPDGEPDGVGNVEIPSIVEKNRDRINQAIIISSVFIVLVIAVVVAKIVINSKMKKRK